MKKMRSVLVSGMVAALMVLGSAPAAHAGYLDNDKATAIGGHGGNGGIAAGIGVCLINIAVIGDAGCAKNGVADASGGDGGDAKAIADLN
jgi:hypothetical protein